jgi:hypothetical protein
VISLRYHVITIVSVFLALAVGTLVGGAFVQPVLQQQLEDRTDELQTLNGQLREQIDEVQAQVQAANTFVDATLPYLVENRLLGTQVVLVALDGVEDGVLGQTQRSLVDAGARVVAAVLARDQIASQDADTQARLADLLAIPATSPEELPSQVASALADRLANGAQGATPEDDPLARLLSEGFLAPIGSGLSEATLAEIGTDGQVVIVLGGSPDPEPTVGPDVFGVPLVRDLAALGVHVAVGESSTTQSPFVGLVRDGGTDGLVTVDDLDLGMGAAALVLGLDRLLTTGQGGAYGIKDGAEALPAP